MQLCKWTLVPSHAIWCRLKSNSLSHLHSYRDEASITIQSPGVSSYTLNATFVRWSADSTKLQFAPRTLLSDGNSYNSITLGLVDGNGQPAQAPVNTVVTLSSTIPSVGQIQSTVTIPVGQTYVRATSRLSGLQVRHLITATTSNYTSTNSTLFLVTKAATNLGTVNFSRDRASEWTTVSKLGNSVARWIRRSRKD